jgi:hypothetical protein
LLLRRGVKIEIRTVNDTSQIDFKIIRQEWIEEFQRIGFKYGTDKINHKYHNFYGLFLGSLRNHALKMVEIGLGCNMRYDPGKSLSFWRCYIPKAHISILQFDSVTKLTSYIYIYIYRGSE